MPSSRARPPLRAALDDREGDGRVDADDERTIAELRRLRWLVDCVLIVEDLPDDPAVVELVGRL
jgi:hypothetical protein